LEEGGIIVCVRLLLPAGSDDKRLLAHLNMIDATPLGRWRGFRLHYKQRFVVTRLRPSANFTIASTTAFTETVLSRLWWHDDLRREFSKRKTPSVLT